MSNIISAIDIGSNAIRMIVAEAQEPHFRVIKKFRAPVRLGKDVFMQGQISPKTQAAARQAFQMFAEVNKKYGVQRCRAVATSAVRESRNKDAFVKSVLDDSKIKIEVIDGLEEARLIHLAVKKELDLRQKRIMLIDVGGGSVEITFSNNGSMAATSSFPMGTVRILNSLARRHMLETQLNVIMGEFLDPLSRYIHSQTDASQVDFAVGTGGNLECMGRLKVQMLKKTPNTFLTAKELGQIIDLLKKMTIRERISKLDLKPDRADVILPACLLIQTILRQAEVEKIMIPCVGLRDGLIWSLGTI